MMSESSTDGMQSSVFVSPTWFDAWLAAFGEQDAGYWPLQPNAGGRRIPYVIQTRKIGPISLRVAAAAANSHTPRFDAMGEGTPTGGELRRMLKDLRVSALIFPYLAPSSRLLASLQADRKAFRWERDFCEDAPFIDCAGSWRAYLESRGQKRRSSWHKYERRMTRSGGAFELLTAWQDISPCIPEVLQIEASGWKGQAGSSIAQDPTTRRFYEGVCEDLAKLGKLRLFLIRRNGRIIAFQLATLHAGTLSGLKASYLDAFAKESPGQLLQFWITRWAFAEEGVHTYDLLGPSSEYKLRFSTGVERLETLYVFAPNAAGLTAWLRWSLLPRLKHLLRKAMTGTFGVEAVTPNQRAAILSPEPAGDVAEVDQNSTTLFASSIWFSSWLDAFGGPQAGIWHPQGQPHSVRIPYVVTTKRIGPFSVSIAAGASNSFTPRFDASGQGMPTAADLLQMARDLKVAALVFPYLAADSKIAQVTVTEAHRFWWFRAPCEDAPFVDCTGSWEEYLQGRKKSHRSRWLSSERRVLKAGGRFEKLESWRDISARFDEVLDVEASGWKGQGGTAIKQSADALRFFRSVCARLAEQGKLRLFLLCREESIVAFRLCTLHQGVLSSLKIGYRAEFSKEGPGNVLKLWTAKWAFEQPDVRIFDTLGPSSADKLMWSTGVESLDTLYVLRQNLGGAMIWLRFSLAPRLKEKLIALRPSSNLERQPEGRYTPGISWTGWYRRAAPTE